VALWETIAGGVVGGIAGAFTAYVTARGKVQAVHAELGGRLDEIELRRAHELEDRRAVATDASKAATSEQFEALARAATALVSALRRPDAMQHNVTLARRQVDEATSRVSTDEPVGALAVRLHEVSQSGTLADAEAILHELREAR
jgi:hypothetical protein